VAFAETFSELGKEKAKKNAWSGGSFAIEEAKLMSIDPEGTTLEIEATVKERKSSRVERVSIDLGTFKLSLCAWIFGTVFVFLMH
jgi:hypothetical protein